MTLRLSCLLAFCLHFVTAFSVNSRHFYHKAGKNDHASTTRMLYMGGGISRGALLPKIMTAIEDSKHRDKRTDDIVSMIDEIGSQNTVFMNNAEVLKVRLHGKWALLWSSEKLRKRNDVTHDINLNDGTITTTMKYLPYSLVSVAGDIAVDKCNKNRMRFRYSKGLLNNNWSLTLPIISVFEGWFYVVYLNDMYKFMKDFRGNYFVFQRS